MRAAIEPSPRATTAAPVDSGALAVPRVVSKQSRTRPLPTAAGATLKAWRSGSAVAFAVRPSPRLPPAPPAGEPIDEVCVHRATPERLRTARRKAAISSRAPAAPSAPAMVLIGTPRCQKR